MITMERQNDMGPTRAQASPNNRMISVFGEKLLYWGRDKVVASLQTIFTNLFSCTKIAVFPFNYNLNLIPKVQWTKTALV